MAKIKKNITSDWANAIPQLVQFSHNKFYELLGPLVIGIELIKLPREDKYRPHIVIYKLWGNKMGTDIKSCLAGPTLLKELLTKKGLQYDISYDDHSVKFLDAVSQIKKQLFIPIGENVKIKSLLEAIDKYSKSSEIIAQGQMRTIALLEMKYYLSLFYGDEKYINNTINQISKSQKKWNMEHFKIIFGDYDTWLDSLKNTNRNDFMKLVNENRDDDLLKKISSFDIL